MDSLTRHAPLLGEIARERLRDELQKTVLADLRYPMLRRRKPASASGLWTLRHCGAWPLLLDAAFDGQAVDALAALAWEEAPLAGRLALLMRRMEPVDARTALLGLRFSGRDAALAARYIAALRHFAAAGDDAFETVRLGRDVAGYARAAFCALRDGTGEARAAQALEALRGAPWSLGELCVTGHDLMPLFLAAGVPQRRMGRLLEALWRMAATGAAPNEKAALLGAAKGWLDTIEGE